MPNRDGVDMVPSIDFGAEPRPKFPQHILLVGLQGSFTHKCSSNPMQTIWMRVKVGGNMDVKNTVAFHAPFFVEQQACTLERWPWCRKHHGAGQTFNRSMSVDRFWQEFGGNVLRHSEHHPVMDVVFFTDTNAGCRHLLNRRVQHGGGRSKPVEQLLWHRLNAVFGHHHSTVRHGPPCEIRKGESLRKGRVKRDSCKQRFKNAFGRRAEPTIVQSLDDGWRWCIHRTLQVVRRGGHSPFEEP